ncbi:MAG: alpha-amylase [Elusimicrobia bacterium]|nr:alpha-amylase [Elusimicrobiota bacterium]
MKSKLFYKLILAFLTFAVFVVFSHSAYRGESTVMMQGFHWTSWKTSPWWSVLGNKASEMSSAGIDLIWFPPSFDSLSPEGYLPRKLNLQDSKYGSEAQLISAIKSFHSNGIKVIGDIVVNHRVGTLDWADFTDPTWAPNSVCSDDEWGQGQGAADSGKTYEAARDIDHTQAYVRESVSMWLNHLRNKIGYDGWRYDYARGIAPVYYNLYSQTSSSVFSVAEIWDNLDVNNSDSHRQQLCDWMESAGGNIKAFDFTTKGVLQHAINNREYWRLIDKNSAPSGLIGWWPANAVTFIDNHDTVNRVSSPGHRAWPFPANKIMQGYAYILTHPGIPCIYWTHFFDYGLKNEITALIKIRKAYGINSASYVRIVKAVPDVYSAIIDETIAIKIGPGYWEPGADWQLQAQGYEYKVWVKK